MENILGMCFEKIKSILPRNSFIAQIAKSTVKGAKPTNENSKNHENSIQFKIWSRCLMGMRIDAKHGKIEQNRFCTFWAGNILPVGPNDFIWKQRQTVTSDWFDVDSCRWYLRWNCKKKLRLILVRKFESFVHINV